MLSLIGRASGGVNVASKLLQEFSEGMDVVSEEMGVSLKEVGLVPAELDVVGTGCWGLVAVKLSVSKGTSSGRFSTAAAGEEVSF